MEKKEKKSFFKRKWVWALIALVVIVAAMPGDEKDDGAKDSQVQPKVEDVKAPEMEKSGMAPDGKPNPEPEAEPEFKDTATTGEKNALKKAQSYLSFSAFSYDGLIGQLEYEQFSHDEAVYAVENCGADWNEQALLKAKSYLSMSGFSYTGLIGQLEYEKFTTEQATYGAENCGADWNEQAAIKAESYLDNSSFSKDSLIEQLEYEGFTHEQAVYGVKKNGY